MKVLFLTNMPSYYQFELADAMVDLLGIDNFRLGFHRSLSDDRLEMGWLDNRIKPYALRWSGSLAERQEMMQWIDQADVVIQGRFPSKYIRRRVNDKKLTFAYQERFWKKPFSPFKLLARLPRLVRDYYSLNKSNYHLLATGAYVASDLNRLGLFKQRSWKFGYFIKAQQHLPARDPNKSTLDLVWCGRFCAFKQPLRAIAIAEQLKRRGVNFALTMIGAGELSDEVTSEIRAKQLRDQINLVGWQTTDQVHNHMAKADCLLMTSHHGEGWGLVVNEAMQQGCAIIANKKAGSVPWLVDQQKSGLIYKDTDIETLLDQLTHLSARDWQAMGKAGFATINSTWSAESAAKRLIHLAEILISDPAAAKYVYQQGPCSMAN